MLARFQTLLIDTYSQLTFTCSKSNMVKVNIRIPAGVFIVNFEQTSHFF